MYAHGSLWDLQGCMTCRHCVPRCTRKRSQASRRAALSGHAPEVARRPQPAPAAMTQKGREHCALFVTRLLKRTLLNSESKSLPADRRTCWGQAELRAPAERVIPLELRGYDVAGAIAVGIPHTLPNTERVILVLAGWRALHFMPAVTGGPAAGSRAGVSGPDQPRQHSQAGKHEPRKANQESLTSICRQQR